MKSRLEFESVNLGFQMAPMIDIVFVIMLFFMVLGGQMRVERQLSMTLPGKADVPTHDPLPPDEVILVIDDSGAIALNEEEIGGAEDVKLDALASLLVQLRENAALHGGKVLATLETQPDTPYQRIIDVMNALSRAKISNVTFTVGEKN
jgi:biopolymer transport protein ExbD